jgi:uncharacterized repeat protein (TIGR01451 family)
MNHFGGHAVRKKKSLFVLLAGVALLVSTVTVAGALITSTSGVVTKLNSPPASVKLGALESATQVYAFDERQNVTLTSAVAVDATSPGTYSTFPSGNATLPVGSVVDSHLLHSDIPRRNFTARRQGSVTFNADIVGVIAATNRLASSDTQLGAPGTQYAGTTSWRGLESGNENGSYFSDKFTISSDKRTLTFEMQTYVMDEIRVVTKHKNPLVTSITDSPDPVQAGGNVTYTVTVSNPTGTAATGVQVRDAFPGATLVSATAAGGCTGAASPVTCTLGTIAANSSASATIVVTSPASAGTLTNTATQPPSGPDSVSASTTVVSPVLATSIAHSPTNVTQGNDVKYTLTVTNNGIAPVSDAHVVDTLPAGTTLKSGPASCTGTTTVDCALGALTVGQQASVDLIVTLPTIGTASSSAVASPGTNTAATDDTTVEAPQDGVTKGWVEPGGSLTIPGHDPSTVELPNTGDGAPVEITQGAGTFCAGPCTGTTTTVNPFPGYDDPANPIVWTMTYTFNPGDPESTPDSLTAAAAAYNSTIYKHLDTDPPNVGTVIPDCPPTPRVAADYACLSGRAITQPTPNHFVVSFTILYLSGDPTGGRR